MTMPAPLASYRLKSLLLKNETTYGTDAVPVVATNGILAMNMSISIEADKLERPIDFAYFTANPFVLVNKRVTIEFDFEPLGNSSKGTAAPCGPIMQCCAHSETLSAGVSTTYAPISVAIKSSSVYYNINGQQVAVLGCRGTIDFDFTVRQFPKAHAKLIGMFAIPTAVALVAPTLSAWQAPVAVELETFLVSVAGTANNATGFQLSTGEGVDIHEGSETREAAIMDRAATGTIKVFDPGVANFDFWTPAKNYTSQALIASVSGASGKITTINVATSQLELPKWVEDSNVIGLEVPFNAIANTGNDEYSVVFT